MEFFFIYLNSIVLIISIHAFISEVPPGLNLSVENLIWIFWPSPSAAKGKIPAKEIQIYCPEASLVLLHMVRKMINEVGFLFILPCKRTLLRWSNFSFICRWLCFASHAECHAEFSIRSNHFLRPLHSQSPCRILVSFKSVFAVSS